MGQTNIVVSSLLFYITLSRANLSSAVNNSNHSESLQFVTVNETAILLCPVLQEVIKKDGAFDIVYWKYCTSKSCEDQHSKWSWIGGMNNKGMTDVEKGGINITSHGAMEIERVRLSDAGHYMCTVKTIHHTSPRRHFTALSIKRVANEDQYTEATNKTDPAQDCNKDHSDASEKLAYLVPTCLLSVLLVLAVGYIVYLKRDALRRGNQGIASV